MQQGANSATMPAMKDAKSESWNSVSILIFLDYRGGNLTF
jgi:hypothetical protein